MVKFFKPFRFVFFIFNYTFSFLTFSSWNFLVNFETMGYNICTGNNPEVKKYRRGIPREILGFLVVTSVLLNVFIHLKICFHKAKPMLNQSNVAHLVKTFLFGEVDKHSMFSYTFNVCGIFITITGVWAMAQTEKVRFQDLAIYPNYLLLYYINLVCPALFISAVIFSFSQKRYLLNALSHIVKK